MDKKLLKLLADHLGKHCEFGPWKPMSEKMLERSKLFLAELQPILDRKGELQDELSKLEARAGCLNAEYGVDLRRAIGAPDNDAAHINLDHEGGQYRCSIDRKPLDDAEGDGDTKVAGMLAEIDGDGKMKLLGDKPPEWVKEALLKALTEDADDAPKPTVQ